MTARGAALLLLPLPLLAWGAADRGAAVGGGLLLLLAAVLVVIDGRRAPGRSRLRAQRLHEDALAVGRSNLVVVRIDVAGGRRLAALVRDEHPPRLRASCEVMRTTIPGEVAYTVTPPARGVERFGRTVVRVDGPWRLGQRQTALGESTEVRVDPDLSALRAYEALARRGQLAEMGVRMLRRPGEGSEFERVRDAMPDDPLRSINWRATARVGRLMATELVPERAQPVIVCLDHGRLMGTGAGELTKLDHAVSAALLLAHVALRHGDRAGLLAFSDHVTVRLPAVAGRRQLAAIVDAVRPIIPADTETDYDEAFAVLSGWQRRRALLVVLTDVIDVDQGAALARQCARLRRRHLPLVVTVRDPSLDALAGAAPATATAVYGRAVATRMLSEREAMLQVLRRSGADVVDTDARTLSPRLVNRYLELKRRGAL